MYSVVHKNVTVLFGTILVWPADLFSQPGANFLHTLYYFRLKRHCGNYDVKGFVCFVLEFALSTFSPLLPALVQFSKQKIF